MKNFLLKHWLKIVGPIVGALGGYLYNIKVGCLSGTCPITSDPTNSTLYGALLGFLLFSMFSKNPKKEIAEDKIDEK
ncbi:MAG: hypothetical protein GX762_08090 [Bacteroidales bacterium]|nr:hypothetical protein [Bacteroidales bacterium]